MTWMFDRAGAENAARLMYSSRAGSDLLLNLQCNTQGVRAVAMLAPEAAGSWGFTLHSGELSTAVRGDVAAPSAPGAEIAATAPIARNDATLARLAETGEASIEFDDRILPINAINDTERQAIRDFFAACPA